MTISKATVLGAGGGGRASAFQLLEHGLHVTLWEHPDFAANLDDLGDAGFATTTSLASAINGAELIVACVQRPMHHYLATELPRLMRADQMLLLNPGSLGGALEIGEAFRQQGRPRPLLAETSTLTHCARPVPGGVRVTLHVEHVRFAALPASQTETMLQAVKPFYPFLVPAHSVLETGLYNGNPVLHPAIALLNAANIERNDGSFRFYGDGMSPAVARLIEQVDTERQSLARAFGFDLIPEPVLSHLQGYADSDDYLACYRDSAVFGPLTAPNTLDHRYMHEDVGEGLITWLALAEVAGLKLPTIEAIVRLAEVATGRDYTANKPRRLEQLGLQGLSLEDMVNFVRD
ncbi:MAG: NAD/NADP octopine/nopaline dehydrogenase family protein [Armatimonadia bacterium]